MNTIACIFCHTSDHQIVIQENGFNGKKCPTCSLIYISPRPSPQEIVNLYGHDQAYIPAHNHIAQSYPKRLHARHTLSIIKKHCHNRNLLEIGSGAGYFLDEARKAGFVSHGIELNPVQADFIRTHFSIPCSTEPLSTDSFGTRTFDIVYHADVVSHFYDPIAAFATINAKLVHGGYLIFETGNLGDTDEQYFKLFTKFQYPDHLFFFGEKSINQLLEITGFKLVTQYQYTITPQLFINKMLNTIRKNKTLTNSAHASAFQQVHCNTIEEVTKKAYHYLMSNIRYRAGAYMPKKQRPQTIIVVAQKVE